MGQFDLKRPCADCPFRTDIIPYLYRARAQEIEHSLLKMGESFTCHKTNDFDDETGQTIVTRDSKACAGAMILLLKEKAPNQIMQVGMRLSCFDPDELDMTSPVFDSFTEWVEAQDERF